MSRVIGKPVFAYAKTKTQIRERGGLVVNASDSGSRGRGFEPHSGQTVLSLSKACLLPKSTANTQEAVAPSQHG